MESTHKQKEEFINLLDRNQGIIHKISILYSSTHHDKEDLFQEICLQLWRSYTRFRGDSSFSTWMYKVALNTAISYIRKGQREIPVENIIPVYNESADDDSNDEYSNLLYNAIGKLSRVDRALILLWLDEKSYEEISSIIGITKTNVSVKLVRIKKTLENMLKVR